jgi:hypothetical protein
MSAPADDAATIGLRRRVEAQHRTLSAVLDALARTHGAGASVTVGPRLPAPAALPPIAPSPAPEPAGWPQSALPAQALRPPPGWACASVAAGRHPVIAVALFGLDAAALASGVAQIDQRQRRAMNFVPVFLTDHPDATAFRRSGHAVEYFPRAIYGDADAPALFREKVAFVRRKWGVASLVDLSAPGYLEARMPPAVPVAEPEERNAWDRPVPPVGPVPPLDIAAAKAETLARGLDRMPDDFVLYRIIGNDLHPRHRRGQAADNLRFILEREPPLPGCTKAWIVNRIVDPEQEAAVIALLEAHGQAYLHIPFDWDVYAAIAPDLELFPPGGFFTRIDRSAAGARRRMRADVQARRPQVLYAMNNNGARNAAIADGRGRAKWILPWDGNCFLTAGAWREIADAVRTRPYLKYFVVPMARVLDNEMLADPDFRPDAAEEPQVLFRRDADEIFDERVPYGRRPKVQLLWRLGVPGPWDRWVDDIWDLPRPVHATDAGQYLSTGWVARLFSGVAELEVPGRVAISGRELARNEAILATVDHLDQTAMRRRLDPLALTVYDEEALSALAAGEHAPWRDALRREAGLALGRGLSSVLDKTSMPPSGDPHDYWHPAPYWWPDPSKPDGRPFIRRDGERVPGTELYEPGSEKFDRTRLQRLFDDTTILALAWRVEGDATCAQRAADLVRRWFVDPATRMNPHLRYAQVRVGHGDGEGHNSGIIEAKDFYFFLDAVRLLERAGALSTDDVSALRGWLSAYLDWLRAGRQGVTERRTRNNHGTCYDLQVAALAAYLGDVPTLLSTFFISRERLLDQFDAEGAQPEELSRTQTAHYCCFNLQSWVNLATLAEACGVSLWDYPGEGRGLRRGLAWLDGCASRTRWPYRQSGPFDDARFLPLRLTGHRRFGQPGTAGDPSSWKPLFHPHDGIKPFWMLGRDVSGKKQHNL